MSIKDVIHKSWDSSSSKKHSLLNIWVISDEKPGHVNQTEGLIQALSNYRELKIEKMPLFSISKALGMLFLKISDSKLRTIADQQKPDLIIGAGHQTHLSILAFRRCFGGKAVLIMSPSLPVHLFDLCFIPRHDKPAKRYNIVETVGAINRVVPNDSHRKYRDGLILVGGPSKHFIWRSQGVLKQIQNLLEYNSCTSWTIAGSRRTPDCFYEELMALAPDAEIVQPNEVSTAWLPKRINDAGQIWVTADSISMIYEALTSGAKTGIFKLAHKKSTRITEEIDRLQNEGRVINTDTIEGANSDVRPETRLYEADRCAKLILEKLEL